MQEFGACSSREQLVAGARCLMSNLRNIETESEARFGQFLQAEPPRFKCVIARDQLARNPFAEDCDQHEILMEMASAVAV